MALVKPIAQPLAAFDANNKQRFEFVIDNSGDPIVANSITIVNQLTNQVVYYNKKEGSERFQDVPTEGTSSGLVNGGYYYYYFKTFNEDDDSSPQSNSVPFYCYTTPVITLLNMPTGNVLKNSNFDFQFSYSQAEDELLNYIRFDIFAYDEHGNIYGVYTSGNLLANETNQYSASVFGLLNDTQYILDITGVTVQGTKFTLHDQLGDYLHFTVDSQIDDHYAQLEVEPNCSEGYIKVAANLVVTDGTSYDNPTIYNSDKNNIILLPRHKWAEWTQGFALQQSFSMGLWGRIGQAGEILRFGNDRNNSKVVFEYCRGTYEYYLWMGQSLDFIVAKFYNDNGELIGRIFSEPLEMLNPNEWYLIFFKIADYETSRFKFIKQTSSNFELRWNTPTNALFGQMLPNMWEGETWKYYEDTDYKAGEFILEDGHNYSEIYDIIPINQCRLSNGIYDDLFITNDITLTEETITPVWDKNTIFNAPFNGTLSAGNTDMILSEISALRLKRKTLSANKWITLKEYKVEKPEDFNIEYYDLYVPSGIEQLYAIATVDSNGQEIEAKSYIIESTGDFKWKYVFMTIGNTNIKLYSNITYNSFVRNREIGTLNPLSAKFPIVLQNSETSYLSGTLSALILGEDFEKTRQINRLAVVKQITEIHNLLDTGKIICLKDWNGYILICRPVSGDSMTFNANYGNGIGQASFNFVEQAKYDNQQDLYDVGIIDINI